MPRTNRYPLIAATAVLLVLPTACVITESDDPEGSAGAGGGSAATGGQAGSGASAGSAGAAGSGATSGAAGTGAGGTAGGPGDAGPDAEPPVPIPPGYTRATTLYHGTEALMVGSDETDSRLPGTSIQRPGYRVTSFDVSGDGSTVWATLYDEFASTPEEIWEFWSFRTDGSDPQESAAVLASPGSYPAGRVVRTNDAGTAAILTSPHSLGPSGLPRRGYTFHLAGGRGSPFAVISSTDDIPSPPSIGLAQPIYPRMTDDGLGFLFNTGRSIWRINQSDGWVPFEVGRVEDLRFNGNAPPGNERFGGLDMTANGGEWMSTIVFRDTRDHEVVLTGMSIPVTTFEAIENDKFSSETVQIDDAGEVVAYTYNGPGLGDVDSWVGEQGGNTRRIATDVAGVAEVALSGDGRVMHCLNKPSSFATVHTSFFEDVEAGTGRVKAHSNRFGGDGISGAALSDDGSVIASVVNINTTGVTSFGGLWLGRRQAALPGSPDITSMAFRYDDTDDKLIVRVTAEAASGDELKEVAIYPLKDRYVDPAVFLDSTDNPFFWFRNGTTLAPVDGEAGAYEVEIDLDGKRALIDGSFSVRISVSAGPPGSSANRAAFADFSPME